jgi:hypothetical protein
MEDERMSNSKSDFWTVAPAILAAANPAPESSPETAVVSPPDRNTGGRLTNTPSPAQPLTICIDHLSGVFPEPTLRVMVRYISRFFGTPTPRDLGFNGYAKSIEWPKLAMIGWTEGRASGESFLRIHGDGMAVIGDRLLDLFSSLYRMQFRPARIDLALDDHSKKLLPLKSVHRAGENEQFIGPRTYDPRRPKKDGKLKGETYYFGSRGKQGSGCYLRFYDKELESDGLVKSNRMEPEFSDEKAWELWAEMRKCKSLAALQNVCAHAVVGTIGFVKKEGAHGHRDRMSLLRWWKRFLAAVGGILIISPPRSKPKLQDTVEYGRDAYAFSLGKFLLVMEQQGQDGFQMVRDYLRMARLYARKRMKGKDFKEEVDFFDLKTFSPTEILRRLCVFTPPAAA